MVQAACTLYPAHQREEFVLVQDFLPWFKNVSFQANFSSIPSFPSRLKAYKLQKRVSMYRLVQARLRAKLMVEADKDNFGSRQGKESKNLIYQLNLRPKIIIFLASHFASPHLLWPEWVCSYVLKIQH